MKEDDRIAIAQTLTFLCDRYGAVAVREVFSKLPAYQREQNELMERVREYFDNNPPTTRDDE